MSAYYCAECDGPVSENGHECAADRCGNPYCGCRRDRHEDKMGPCLSGAGCVCQLWRNP